MHSGTVEVTSDGFGKGSEFTVRLPILQSSDVVFLEEATTFPGETRAFPCRRILIVDDLTARCLDRRHAAPISGAERAYRS